MRTHTIIGILLIFLGIFFLSYERIIYTKQEKVLDVGPLEANIEREKSIPLSPIAGVALLVSGVALIISGSRSKGS